MFLNLFLVTVSSSELSAFEHRKLWCLHTLCWLHGERSLPMGLLVFENHSLTIDTVCMGEVFRINPEFRILRLTFYGC